MIYYTILILISTALAILAIIFFRPQDPPIEKIMLCSVAAIVGVLGVALLYRQYKKY